MTQHNLVEVENKTSEGDEAKWKQILCDAEPSPQCAQYLVKLETPGELGAASSPNGFLVTCRLGREKTR